MGTFDSSEISTQRTLISAALHCGAAALRNKENTRKSNFFCFVLCFAFQVGCSTGMLHREGGCMFAVGYVPVILRCGDRCGGHSIRQNKDLHFQIVTREQRSLEGSRASACLCVCICYVIVCVCVFCEHFPASPEASAVFCVCMRIFLLQRSIYMFLCVLLDSLYVFSEYFSASPGVCTCLCVSVLCDSLYVFSERFSASPGAFTCLSVFYVTVCVYLVSIFLPLRGLITQTVSPL